VATPDACGRGHGSHAAIQVATGPRLRLLHACVRSVQMQLVTDLANPGGRARLAAGDLVAVLGTRDQIARFEEASRGDPYRR